MKIFRNSSNMARITAKLCQNAFRTIPEISFFGVDFFSSKLRTAVYHPRMAPFSLKLWENALQMIPGISFFDAKHFFSTNIFVGNVLFVNPPKKFQQSACVGRPVNVWTSPSDAPRKFIAKHIGFSLLLQYDPWRRGKRGGFCF